MAYGYPASSLRLESSLSLSQIQEIASARRVLSGKCHAHVTCQLSVALQFLKDTRKPLAVAPYLVVGMLLQQ
jgi:hypothetical protein